MSLPLNLASRPFRNETLPNLVFALAAAALLVASVRHAFLLREVLPRRSSALHAEVATLEKQLEGLRSAARSARAPVPEAARVAEWRLVQDLVDRRTFSWRTLLARLEEVLPPGVRLVSITPKESGGLTLDVLAVARTRDDAFEFVQALKEKGGFDNVYPLGLTARTGGEELQVTMRYAVPGTSRDRGKTGGPPGASR